MTNTLTLKSRYDESVEFEALQNMLFIYSHVKFDSSNTTIMLTYAQAKELKMFLERNFS